MSAGVSPGRIKLSCGAGGKAGPADSGRKVTLGQRLLLAQQPSGRTLQAVSTALRLCQGRETCRDHKH